jgi:two-component system, NarL family, invasion response regulator UvrY
MIRVLIADDHPIVRKGLRQIVADEPDMTVVADTGDGREVLRLVDEQALDVILLDINMPGLSGLEVLSQLKQRQQRLPVLVLSVHPEGELAMRVLKAGASGYLNKEIAPEELTKAIRLVVGGKKYVSATLGELLVNSLERGSDPPHSALSDREYQVFTLIASGKTVSEIAAEIALSVKTVSTYRARILEKMSMRTNAELTHYAVRNRLVE